MAPKARLFSSGGRWALGVLALPGLAGCTTGPGSASATPPPEPLVPAVVVPASDARLQVANGVYYLAGRPFSGFVEARYPNGTRQALASYWQGRQQGFTRAYYPGGQLREARCYRAGQGYGRHYGFWENGRPKFDFTYYDDRREGLQRQWYPSGQLYLRLHYTHDSETGRQQGWRENGKLFANYEVRDGIRYGLQKTNLCYTLRKEKLK